MRRGLASTGMVCEAGRAADLALPTEGVGGSGRGREGIVGLEGDSEGPGRRLPKVAKNGGGVGGRNSVFGGRSKTAQF